MSKVKFRDLEVGEYFRYGNGWLNLHKKTGPKSAENYYGNKVGFLLNWRVRRANRDGTRRES